MLHVELPAREPFHEQRSFAQEIRRVVPKPQVVLFFRVEAHGLAFHLGMPLNTFLEWENLDVWAGRPGTHYIVMTPEAAAEWPLHVSSGTLEEVCRNTAAGPHEKPLVLMRTKAGHDDSPCQQAGNRQGSDQPGIAGVGSGRLAPEGRNRMD
jgi:hypothetical protein